MVVIAKPRIASIEISPDVSAAAATTCADEPRLDIRQPHLIIPAASV